jgi:hypothetical protein
MKNRVHPLFFVLLYRDGVDGANPHTDTALMAVAVFEYVFYIHELFELIYKFFVVAVEK